VSGTINPVPGIISRIQMPSTDMPEVPDPPPTPPEKPLPMDCCGGGCAMCVMDVYDEAMQRYAAELAEWEARNNPRKAG
jgi:hypothetical protein